MTRLSIKTQSEEEVVLGIWEGFMQDAQEVGQIIVDLKRNDVNIRVERDDEALAGPVKVTCP